MTVTVFLARFWGSLFLLLGAFVMTKRFLGTVIRFTETPAITVSTGYITFLLGLATVVAHNVWVFDWPVTITVLGWVTLLKGIEKVLFPGRVNKTAQLFKGGQQWWGFVIFLIGVWFFWFGIS